MLVVTIIIVIAFLSAVMIGIILGAADEEERRLDDLEQMEYLRKWQEEQRK